jgi:16S rRNA (guanine527-N7)-methyltransferase
MADDFDVLGRPEFSLSRTPHLQSTPMQPARIAELLAPFLDDASNQRLTTSDLDRISTYIDILQRWNARINLTAVRDPEEIVTRHFGESLFAARILFPDETEEHGREVPQTRVRTSGGRASLQGRVNGEKINGNLAPAPTVADIGSGAGFPGIPIKLWRPDVSLTLIESNHKKATFLREVARAITLTNINILAARAESLKEEAFDVVTIRAVERFENILPVAAHLVAPGGRLALLIGAPQLSTASSILSHIPGFNADDLAATPVPLSNARVLVLPERST